MTRCQPRPTSLRSTHAEPPRRRVAARRRWPRCSPALRCCSRACSAVACGTIDGRCCPTAASSSARAAARAATPRRRSTAGARSAPARSPAATSASPSRYIDGDWSTPDLARCSNVRVATRPSCGAMRSVLPAAALARIAAPRGARATRARQPAQHRRPLRPRQRVLRALARRRHELFLGALYARPAQTLEAAQAAKLDRIVELLRLRRRASACSRSAAAGAASPSDRARERGARHRPDALDRAARLMRGAHRRGRPRRPRRPAPAGLPRRRRARSTASSRSRCWRRSASATGRPTSTRCATAARRRRRRAAGHHHRRRALRRLSPAPISSSATSSPAACCRRPARSQARPSAPASGRTAELFGDELRRDPGRMARRFLAAWPQIAALGFDDAFRRLWEYYLCYCEAGLAYRAGRRRHLYTLERANADIGHAGCCGSGLDEGGPTGRTWHTSCLC